METAFETQRDNELRGDVGALRTRVADVYRNESRRVFATLVRLLGDFELAEEALHEAFAAALEQWRRDGIPNHPRAWLVTVGRCRGLDAMRRRRRHDLATAHLSVLEESAWPPQQVPAIEDEIDDRLRLLFACCRPDLPPDAQIAMTLRELCGLTTEEIARAYLTRAPTIAQRIVRAKQRIREARIPYEVPELAELPARRDLVMRVIYLVFNEGYSASSGPERIRRDLCVEAIRLARLLVEWVPSPEANGLLALLLLQDARRAARMSASGEIVLLADQDRSLWDRESIAEGTALVERALEEGGRGPYTLQAAIAAVYAESVDNDSIDWAQIVALHDVLGHIDPSPVARLARAIAIAGRDGAAAGLALVEALLDGDELGDYLPAHAARAELCQRLGRAEDALASLRRALGLARQDPERRSLQRRITELEAPLPVPLE
jgi:RNA polymerase sigma-70 factor (ECF subfamily)